MDPNYLFSQKRIVAKNTLAIKVQIHGLNCEVEIPDDYLSTYGEESGHIVYKPYPDLKRVLISNSTQQNMKATADILNSTENNDLYLVMFEDDILPRNSRLKIYMQDGNYRQLQVRDNIKNEGTFVIHQELVPCINTVDETPPEVGNNILPEQPEEPSGSGSGSGEEGFNNPLLNIYQGAILPKSGIGNNL